MRRLGRGAISRALDVSGLSLLAAAGWLWTPIAGLVVAGIGLLALSWGMAE
jgi:hypothetical protein